MVCQKCRHLSDFNAALFDGPEAPSCPECVQLDSVRTNIAGKRSHGVGKLRPRIVLYNEYNPDEDAIGAVSGADLKCRPDAIIVVGTSLKVPGVRRIVKEMCGVVRGRKDGVAIWINNGPEPLGREFDKCWDIVVRGDADEVARHADLGRWDIDETGDYEEVDLLVETGIKRKRSEIEVVVETDITRKTSDEGTKLVAGVPTPAPSPLIKKQEMADIQRLDLAKPSAASVPSKKKPRKQSTLLNGLKAAASKPKTTKPSVAATATRPQTTKTKATKAKPVSSSKIGAMKISTAFRVSKASASASTTTKGKAEKQTFQFINQFPNLGIFSKQTKVQAVEVQAAVTTPLLGQTSNQKIEASERRLTGDVVNGKEEEIEEEQQLVIQGVQQSIVG